MVTVIIIHVEVELLIHILAPLLMGLDEPLDVLYPQWGTRKRLYGGCVRSVLLSGCQAVSAAVRPLCAVGLSGSCQAVRLGPDSDGTPCLSDSAVRLSDTCCQTVRESAVSAVRLSGTVRRCPGVAVRLSDQGSGGELSA